eukprot:1885724-Amphidinium_carterae.1
MMPHVDAFEASFEAFVLRTTRVASENISICAKILTQHAGSKLSYKASRKRFAATLGSHH